MSAAPPGAPGAPPQGGSNKTLFLVLGGVFGCFFLACVGVVVVIFVVPLLATGALVVSAPAIGEAAKNARYSYYDPDTGKTVTYQPDEECCCRFGLYGEEYTWDFEVARTCVEDSRVGRCVAESECAEGIGN